MQIEPGNFYPMTNTDYHFGAGKDGKSKSDLAPILESPWQYHYDRKHKQQLDPFAKAQVKYNRGTAFHTWFLERAKFEKEIWVEPVAKTGKPAAAEWAKFKEDVKASNGKLTPISPAIMDMIQESDTALHSGYFEEARTIIERPDNFIEKAGFFEHKGILLKIKPDLIDSDQWIWDLKTHATVKTFTWQADELHYDLQAYMGKIGVEAITGKPVKGFGFIVFYTGNPPYEIEARRCDEEFMESGRQKFETAIDAYLTCSALGQWPPKRKDEIRPLGITDWRRKQMKG